MSATKEQERAALAQIREIVAGLGEDSYVGKAFEGCFDMAETNIDCDFMDSMKERAEGYIKQIDHWANMYNGVTVELGRLKAEVDRLTARVEREEEWRPHEIEGNTTQAEYNELAADSSARELSDDEAAQLIADEFGFDRDKIVILREINVYEINRHRRLRKVGTTPRRPLFDAWDWYYICFCVKGHGDMTWEVHNGNLHLCTY